MSRTTQLAVTAALAAFAAVPGEQLEAEQTAPVKVICREFSRYHDLLTDTEFTPELDRERGVYVGVAMVSDPEKLDDFRRRSPFEVVEPEGDEIEVDGEEIETVGDETTTEVIDAVPDAQAPAEEQAPAVEISVAAAPEAPAEEPVVETAEASASPTRRRKK